STMPDCREPRGGSAMRLPGKVGIVTAAASGMGRAGAVRFAREGAAVAVVDIDRDRSAAVVREIAEAGGRAFALIAEDSSPIHDRTPQRAQRGKSCYLSL